MATERAIQRSAFRGLPLKSRVVRRHGRKTAPTGSHDAKGNGNGEYGYGQLKARDNDADSGKSPSRSCSECHGWQPNPPPQDHSPGDHGSEKNQKYAHRPGRSGDQHGGDANQQSDRNAEIKENKPTGLV
jgi:hypothetical protein